ncbi:27 kDa hemolymph protein [Scaptodrosophila lebanonensis]|uniref:27 kDa hemolymph protein n=1 Tax=Drosophila lebanonensis TaxID=7225 RepID=A0A6J2TTR6_DROLE|nr:27 kDa hemolymph protein [Scaptodrosophila lebanonensis]
MNKYAFSIVCLLAALGAVFLETQASPAGGSVNMSQLDGLKSQFLPPEYRNTNISIEDIKRIYREKCKKVSGVENSTLYREIEKGAEKLSVCLSSLANLTALQAEMDAARPIGELDTVFSKYCKKAPEAEACVREFSALLQPCLTKEEQQQQTVMMRIGATLLGFACTRGGDQLALFVAEQGPECLEANKEAISHCLNRSFHQYLPKDGSVPDLLSRPELLFSPTHCVDLQSFEGCVVHHLEQCTEITPANIVQSVFRVVKNETNCQAWINARANERPVLLAASGNSTGGGAASLASTLLGTVALALGAIILRV